MSATTATPSSPPVSAAPPRESKIPEIKRKLSITEYIGRHVKLKVGTTGISVGLCPFHEEKTPSFHVSEAAGAYHCKGCGAAGDIINFHQDYHQVPFKDTIAELCRQAGIVNERKKLEGAYLLLDVVSRRYQEGLLGNAQGVPGNQQALDYVTKERGFKLETLKKFGIGYCAGDEFTKYGPKGLDAAVEAGALTASKEEGRRPFNLMSKRLTFTIRNKDGLVVAFGGRKLDESKDGPKYINTQETQYFKKGDVLYGLYEARLGIYRKKYALVTEGYADTAILHQEGMDNTVAVMGASASEAAFASLWGMTKRIVFCLDPDKAGRAGTLRSVELAAATMKDDQCIDIMFLPNDKDPDEYVLEHGVEAFEKLVSQSMPLARFLCDSKLDAEVERLAKTGAPQLNFDVPENRARYAALMDECAATFQSAPALQFEIRREAQATLSAHVIDAALTAKNIDATFEEIRMALSMVGGLTPPVPVATASQQPAAQQATASSTAHNDSPRPDDEPEPDFNEHADQPKVGARRTSLFK